MGWNDRYRRESVWGGVTVTEGESVWGGVTVTEGGVYGVG